MREPDEQYYELLRQAVFNDEAEEALAAAADLGRDLLRRHIPPEEVNYLHHKALLRLAEEEPELRLSQVAARLHGPLLEISMAYSLAFRQQIEQKYTTMINTRLEQSNRLEAIGTLAAGIAHDFNTILGVVTGHAEMLSDELNVNATGQANVEQIIAAALRARDLITRMLEFARRQPVTLQRMDAVGLIHDALKMIRVSLTPSIDIQVCTTLKEAWIVADPTQIHQVVMNLCINARDAMAGAGVIRIGLSAISAPAKDTPLAQGNPSGPSVPAEVKYLRIEVTDNGQGITPEVQRRMFDPFFTTKEPGRGSGLGLSVVYGIVTSLGGDIAIQSMVGAGSSFVILLPMDDSTYGGSASLASLVFAKENFQ